MSLVLASLTACTTLSQLREEKKVPAVTRLTYSKDPIVQQTSGRDILRKLDRETWVEIRNTSKDEYIRLYATLGTGEWDVAVSDARAMLQKQPKDEVALTVLSLALAMKKNYSLAAYYAKLLNTYHPGNPEVYNILGLAAMHKPGATVDDYKEAMRHFQTAFDTSSQQVASGLNLAHLQLEMGNATAARDTFEAVVSRCSGCTEAQLGYGIALSRSGEYERAESAFEAILKKEPHSAYARYYLALVAKYGRNDNKDAIQQLTALLEDPETKNVDIQRKANFLLRRIQAQVYSRPKDTDIAERTMSPAAKGPQKAAEVAPISDEEGDALEKALNAD
jgi:tetratricopeptide (TPR) repeat protein